MTPQFGKQLFRAILITLGLSPWIMGWFLHFHIQNRPPSDIYIAVMNENNSEASKIIASGADVNKYHGRSPLDGAAGRGNLKIVEQLLHAGAEVENSRYGNKPLLAATLWVSYTNPVPSLEILHLLLRHGADVNERARSGDSALHWASGSGRAEVAAFLIAAGADVNAVACDGETPLIKAARRGHTETVKTLINAKASVWVRNSTGHTAFDAARASGEKQGEIVNILNQSRILTIPAIFDAPSCYLPMKVSVMKEWGDQHSVVLGHEVWHRIYLNSFAIIVFSWLIALILGAIIQDGTLMKILVLPILAIVVVLVLWIILGILTLES